MESKTYSLIACNQLEWPPPLLLRFSFQTGLFPPDMRSPSIPRFPSPAWALFECLLSIPTCSFPPLQLHLLLASSVSSIYHIPCHPSPASWFPWLACPVVPVTIALRRVARHRTFQSFIRAKVPGTSLSTGAMIGDSWCAGLAHS